MAYGVNLGEAGIPDCDFQATGETKDDVMAKARDHLSAEHSSLPNQEELLQTIQALIAPIKG